MSVINEKLIKEFCSMAHYEGGLGKEHHVLLNKSLPPSLYLGPLDLFHERSLDVERDEVFSARMKLYIGLIQWNEGSRGNGRVRGSCGENHYCWSSGECRKGK